METTLPIDPSAGDARLDLFDLWRQYHFETDCLADLAGVSEEAVLAMLRFQPVPRDVARQVLSIVETLYPGGYSLTTVKVKLLDQAEADAMDASELAAIGRRLQNTTEYAIDPAFKKALNRKFSQQFQAQKEKRT